VTGDWRDYRPAIWIAMVAVAVALLVQPWSISLVLLGGAAGFALGVPKRRRTAAAARERQRAEAGPGGRRRRPKQSGGKRPRP
jgi:hypothetical protein